MFRSEASGGKTAQLDDGETHTLSLDLDGTGLYEITVRYSNDNFGPLETIQVRLDGESVGQFEAQDTGDFGFGWNVFESSGPLGSLILGPGSHDVTIAVAGGDGFGVEIDVVSLDAIPVVRPLELGTTTVYGVGSSILHAPEHAISALWEARQQGLLHPRFGFADAFNLEIADAVIPGCVDSLESRVLRAGGSWASFTGFAIDHGPMLILIDSYLANRFSPKMFVSYPAVSDALDLLFPAREETPKPTDTPVPPEPTGAMAIDCGAVPGVQDQCTHGVGSTFPIEIHVTEPPDGGKFGFQVKLAWPDELIEYLPTQESADEGLWPECTLPLRFDNQTADPPGASVAFACIPQPPLAEGKVATGAIVRLELLCKTLGEGDLTLVPREGDLQRGTHFLDEGSNELDPILASAQVTCSPDKDGDGCTAAQEEGFDPPRNPNNFWDFFDTPDVTNVRDKAITAADLARVVARFGTSGDKAIDPFSPPGPATAYHTAFDRTPAGQAPTNGIAQGPNGSVSAQDVALIVSQFGDTCA